MKKIKFRAWDKENKEWVKTKSGGFSLNYRTVKPEYTFSDTFRLQDWETLRNISAFPGNYEIVQFTGLKDRKGKEIYEGDIVGGVNGWTMTDRDRGYMTPYDMEVRWNEEELCWKLHNLSDGHETWNLGRWRSEECEVIGNIYEKIKDIKEMTLEELEQESVENKSTTQKLTESELRQLEINTEILRRLKERIKR